MGNAGRPRSATQARRVLTALVALALAVSGLAGLGSAPPAARAQETEQITQREFDRLTRAGQRNEVIFGPEDGALELEEGELAAVTAGVDVENFLLHVEFENPYDAADGPWDYGVQFRATQGSVLALILLNDGSWGLIDPDALVADGTAEGIGDGAADTNAIDLYVEGDVAHFAFNGDYVATVEMTVDGEGDVGLFSGFLSEDIPSGAETGFAEWIVWSLEGSQTDDEETPDPDDEELSDDDLTATAEAEDEETPEAGDAPTYESPRFGYTLSYDDPWELADELSDDDGDLLRLENRDSSLQIVGNETNDTPADCIDALIGQAEDDALEAEIAQDERDRDLRDDSDELSWVVLFLTLEIGGEESEFTGYYECRVIEEGESLLTIIHLAPSDDYNDDIENRTAVLDTIEIGGGGGRDEDETVTPDPDEEETPEAGDATTYESPQFGYTLSYGDPWELDVENSEDGRDTLELSSGDSNLSIYGYELRETPTECLDVILDTLEDSSPLPDVVVTGVEIAEDDRGRELREDSDELAWAEVILSLENDEGEELELIGYYECRVIEEGESLLVVIHLAETAVYEDEAEHRTAVLDTIEIDGGGGSDDDLSDDDLTATAEAEEETPEPDDEETPEADETPEGGDELPDGSVVFILEPVGGAELFPFGSLVPTGPGEADVQMFAFGAEGSAVTIHEGTCRNPGPVEFDLGQIDETGFLDTSIEADVEDVANGDFVMVISTDGTIETALACGVLEPLPEE